MRWNPNAMPIIIELPKNFAQMLNLLSTTLSSFMEVSTVNSSTAARDRGGGAMGP